MDLASAPLPSSRPLASSNIGWGWDLTTKALPAANKQLIRIAAAENATGQSTHQKNMRTTRRLPMASSMASASTSDRFSLVPPPPVFDLPAPATEEQQTKRAKTMADIQTISASAWEASTVATYSKALCISIHNIEREIGADLLPFDSPGEIMLLFAPMSGMAWGSVRINKSAVRAWHCARNLSSMYDASWDDTALLFWRGLKKQCIHVPNLKRPILLAELDLFCSNRLACDTPAGIRDAALGCFSFFGVRRITEGIALLGKHFFDDGNFINCFIAKQKNDPCGKGQTCFFPSGALTLFSHCPTTLLRNWASKRETMLAGRDATVLPFFCTTGATAGNEMSSDSWRKCVKNIFPEIGVSTHSFRKGGAQFWLHSAGIQEDIVQAQGGWADKELMKRIYATLPPAKIAFTFQNAWAQLRAISPGSSAASSASDAAVAPDPTDDDILVSSDGPPLDYAFAWAPPDLGEMIE